MSDATERAFIKVRDEFWASPHGRPKHTYDEEEEAMRFAFIAGVEHGRKGYAKLESRPMRVPDVSQEPRELDDAD